MTDYEKQMILDQYNLIVKRTKPLESCIPRTSYCESKHWYNYENTIKSNKENIGKLNGLEVQSIIIDDLNVDKYDTTEDHLPTYLL